MFRCPPGSKPGVGNSCLQIDHCLGINPCKAGGICINLPFPGTFRCLCPKGWTGPTCNQQASTVEEVVTAGGIKMEVLVIIIVSLVAVTCKLFSSLEGKNNNRQFLKYWNLLMIFSSDSFKFLSLLSFFEKGEFKMNQFDFFFSNLPIKISYLPATLHI